MKKFDVVLIFVACVLVAILLGFSSFSVETETAGGGGSGFFSTFIKIALSFFLFFYVMGWKLAQYRDKMYPRFQKLLDYHKIVSDFFQRIFNSLNVPKIPLGDKLSLDSVHVLVIVLVLIFLNIL
jgi:hypothetical protein